MNEVAAILHNRIAMYELLSRLFCREVDAALWSALKTGPLPEDTGDEELDAAWAQVRQALETSAADPIEDLAVDYARAFLGAGVIGETVAYPFESVYTSPQKLVMQRAWEEVCAVYSAHGLGRAQGGDLHEDHIGLELHFLAHLAQQAHKALQEANSAAYTKALEDSKRFLTEHVLVWVAAFVKDTQDLPIGEFYKGAAHVLLRFVTLDAAILDDLLQEAS